MIIVVVQAITLAPMADITDADHEEIINFMGAALPKMYYYPVLKALVYLTSVFLSVC